MSFQERLKQVVGQYPSARQFALKTGVSESGLNQWLKGTSEPTLQSLLSISKAAGVSVEWLSTGIGNGPGGSTLVEAEHGSPHNLGGPARGLREPEALVRYFSLVPFYQDIAAGAGPGPQIFDEGNVGQLAFSRSWLWYEMNLRGKDLAVIRCKGDSMTPTLNDGDALLLALGPQPFAEGSVYVIKVDGNLMVKRVRVTAAGVTLISDNPDYPPQDIPKDQLNALEIIGRVVWRGGRKI